MKSNTTKIEIDLRSRSNHVFTLYIDVIESSLSKKWLTALNQLLAENYHLEKNYCWFGFVEGERNAEFLCQQINASIAAINNSNLDYHIDDFFSVSNTIGNDLRLNQNKLNWLHRYFEDLQGVSGNPSPYFQKADPTIQWHIRQLNLYCHEYESLVLGMRRAATLPDWRRPSQLMCWLNAPRYMLDDSDYELFGVETLSRKTGGVYVGVNKAVGKHHWEVFNDEGRDSRIDELVTTTLKNQTEAAGDFDIEWAKDPSGRSWHEKTLDDFRNWLRVNGFDPADKTLTIGHPQVAQVDLDLSFGTTAHFEIWAKLAEHLDVYKIRTNDVEAVYDYRWDDAGFMQEQIKRIANRS